MKYKIVRSDKSSEMEYEVNKLIAEGWTPLGGICVHSDAYVGIPKEYYQAMTKDIKPV